MAKKFLLMMTVLVAVLLQACGTTDGLTNADLPAATITVKDADDGDYSTNFTLTVKNGRLALSNSKAAGLTIIVR